MKTTREETETEKMRRAIPTTVGELLSTPYNPRRITGKAKAGLKASMAEFGDVSGLVFNLRTGHMVGGNQRKSLFPPSAKIEDFREVSDRWGTVGYAFIVHSGKRWPIRFVDWDLPREKAANLAANSQSLAGSFDSTVNDILSEVNSELPDLYRSLMLEELNMVKVASISANLANRPPPPKLAWVLISVPIGDFGKIAEQVEQISQVETAFVQTSISGKGDHEPSEV